VTETRPAESDGVVLARYRETLNRWADKHVPPGTRVTDVQIHFDDGYDPTYGSRAPDLSISIDYAYTGTRDPASGYRYDERGLDEGTASVLANMGQLLTELFAIEGDGEPVAGPGGIEGSASTGRSVSGSPYDPPM
jgi:hypothetical protein